MHVMLGRGNLWTICLCVEAFTYIFSVEMRIIDKVVPPHPNQRVIWVVKRVEFLSYRTSYIVPRGCW